MKKFLLVVIFLLSTALLSSCDKSTDNITLINTAHLDHLYEAIEFESQPGAIIHIYADFPEYKRTPAPGEGIACIDDMARAAVFYLRCFEYSGISEYSEKSRRLLNMIIMMQAENGYFYNFIDKHYQIEKLILNSQPEGNWWSWRAMWAIGEAYHFWLETDPEWANQLAESMRKALPAVHTLDDVYPNKTTFQGFECPAWLPLRYAADQSAVLLMALVPFAEATGDSTLLPLIDHQCRGMIAMQLGDATHFPYGAFLSWQSMWHSYGNSQASAILMAHPLLKNEAFLSAAQTEIDHFYPWLERHDHLNRIRFTQNSDSISVAEQVSFEQIAYGIRPMVWAALQAWTITKNQKYAVQAAELAGWLLGKNPAHQLMYDPETGRCFDGINSALEINKNSGAESTIEALLTILEIEKNPIARDLFHSFYFQQKDR